MKQNHTHTLRNSKDDAVTSIVGEMLLLAIGIVLVAVFAVSLMNLLPGDRDDQVDVVMNASTSEKTIAFWHKGGDVIAGTQLHVLVYNSSNLSHQRQVTLLEHNLTNSTGADTTIFDIGGKFQVTVTGLESGDQVRLTTGRTIIYAGEVIAA